MDIKQIEKLLADYTTFPPVKYEPTYLELCRYPCHRFEEICSRLIIFFSQPKHEHGFKDLFVKSLIAVLGTEDKLQYSNSNIETLEEVYAEGKRIDIVLKASNFVIGIENKIYADLYNPLDFYRKRINEYGLEYNIGLVLSLKRLTLPEHIEKMKQNEFQNITYLEWFTEIKKNIGFYMSGCNQQYLTYLNDFIKTIENMSSQNTVNAELREYFLKNSAGIEALVEQYRQFNADIRRERFDRLKQILELIKEVSLPKIVEVNIYQDWDLVIKIAIPEGTNIHKYTLGIETEFETKGSVPCGKFKIRITTWFLEDWRFCRNSIEKEFPEHRVEEIDNRAIKLYKTLEGTDSTTLTNQSIASEIIFLVKRLSELQYE